MAKKFKFKKKSLKKIIIWGLVISALILIIYLANSSLVSQSIIQGSPSAFSGGAGGGLG